MGIQSINRHFFFVLISTIQYMGCSIVNGPLDMYKQQGVQNVLSRSLEYFSNVEHYYQKKDIKNKNRIELNIIKKWCPGIVCFDFFHTLFLFECEKPSEIRESQLFPKNEDTLYTFDTMVMSLGGGSGINIVGSKIIFTMFQYKIQIWEEDSHSAPRKSKYSALHLEPLVKASLEKKKDWLRDPKGLKNVIVSLLNQNYKVAFYGFLKCPYLIPCTLKHIGLSEEQISSIYMVCSSSKSESDITCIYGTWRVLQRLLGSQEVDYTLMLGDAFYRYAVRFGRSPDRFDENGLNIVIPISQQQMYDWKKLLLITGRLSNLIEEYKQRSDNSVAWHTKIDARQNITTKPNMVGMSYPISKPKIMGMTYRIIKHIGPRSSLYSPNRSESAI